MLQIYSSKWAETAAFASLGVDLSLSIMNLGVFKKDLAAADGHFEVFARLFRVCGF